MVETELKTAARNVIRKRNKQKPAPPPEITCSGFVEPNPHFTAWTKTLPETHWARYDLSACRLGWEAAIVWMRSAAATLGGGANRKD